MSDQLQGQGIELRPKTKTTCRSSPASQQCPVLLEKPVWGLRAFQRLEGSGSLPTFSLSESRQILKGWLMATSHDLCLCCSFCLARPSSPSPSDTNFTFKTQVKYLPLKEDFLHFPTPEEPSSLYRKPLSHPPYWPKHTASKDTV